MTIDRPKKEELTALLGEKYDDFFYIERMVRQYYDMEEIWYSGGCGWTYDYRFRRGGKTLCTISLKENGVSIIVVFGGAEREKIELARSEYGKSVMETYDAAETFHDGKWVRFEEPTRAETDDIVKMLSVKRRPNRK